MRKLLYFIVLLFILLFSFNSYLYVKQPAMVFYPVKYIDTTPKDWGLDYEVVELELKDKTKISGWYFPHSEADKTVLFFHGNGGNISHRGDSIYILHKLKLNVLIIDYPGYGKSTGQPSEHGLYQSANIAWDYLVSDRKVKAKNIIIFGRSLGGAIAVDLASRVKAGALILESTFTSIRDIVNIAFPVISYFVYLRYSFDSLSKISNLKLPVLLIHSDTDEVIPFELGKKLYSAIPSKKRFLQIEGGHNDGFMQSIHAYMPSLAVFIQSI